MAINGSEIECLLRMFLYRDRIEYFENKKTAFPGEIISEYLTHLIRKSS